MSRVVNINNSILPIEELHLAYITHKFRNDYGYAESARQEVPLNGEGKIIPRYVYPCYEYLNSIDWTDCNVFEFGCGWSTVWWKTLGANVYGVELDPDWALKLQDYGEFNITVQTDKKEYPKTIYKHDIKFDVIVLDCRYVRYECVLPAINCVADGGMIVLDNSEWWRKSKEALDKCDDFIPIHFHGFKALNVESETTSCYIHKEFDKKPKTILPMGGTKREPAENLQC